jgi:acetylornithine deacetylase
MDHVRLLRQLVAIDSVNPDLVAGAAGEQEIARFVATWLDNRGLQVVAEEAAPGRPNVIGIVRGRGNGRSLMINAHMDTVGTGAMADPFVPRVEAGRLYGRGAYDMKGSLAAAMIACVALAKDPPAGDVILTAVCDEEYASIGTSAVLRSRRADAAIVTEPTGLNVCIAHKGFIWFEIDSAGVAAHGSKPELGIDAIAKVGRVLTGIEALDQSLRERPRHDLLGSGSVHALLITGGQELSTYPERCRLSVERRTVPGEKTAEAEAQLREVIDRASLADPRASFTLRTSLVRDSFEISPDQEIVRLVCGAVERQAGTQARLYGDTPWFDAALISAAGIPTVVFGPGGGGAHAAVEWSNLDDVSACARILESVAREFCGYRRGS